MNAFIRQVRKSSKGIAFLLLVYVLLIEFATSDPELHDFLHGDLHATHCCEHEKTSDSDTNEDEDHICAITLFSGGFALLYEYLKVEDPIWEQQFPPTTGFFAYYPELVFQSQARAPPIYS